MDYNVGDRVTYKTFSGTSRTVMVVEKHEDIKNGYAGFDGDNDEGTFWGYDDQIVRVEKATESLETVRPKC